MKIAKPFIIITMLILSFYIIASNKRVDDKSFEIYKDDVEVLKYEAPNYKVPK